MLTWHPPIQNIKCTAADSVGIKWGGGFINSFKNYVKSSGYRIAGGGGVRYRTLFRKNNIGLHMKIIFSVFHKFE